MHSATSRVNEVTRRHSSQTRPCRSAAGGCSPCGGHAGRGPQPALLTCVVLGHRASLSRGGLRPQGMEGSVFTKWFGEIFSTRIGNLIYMMGLHAHTHSTRETRNTGTHGHTVSHGIARGRGLSAPVASVGPKAGGPTLFCVWGNLRSLREAPVKATAAHRGATRASPSNRHGSILSPGGRGSASLIFLLSMPAQFEAQGRVCWCQQRGSVFPGYSVHSKICRT